MYTNVYACSHISKLLNTIKLLDVLQQKKHKTTKRKTYSKQKYKWTTLRSQELSMGLSRVPSIQLKYSSNPTIIYLGA